MVDFIGHPNALLKLSETWWEGAVLKGVITNGWTPNVLTDLTYSQISAFEIALAGYTAGGVTLTGKLVELDISGVAHYRASHATWASIATGTVSRFALCANDGVDNWIIGHVDISSRQPNGSPYEVQASGDGWLTDEWGV